MTAPIIIEYNTTEFLEIAFSTELAQTMEVLSESLPDNSPYRETLVKIYADYTIANQQQRIGTISNNEAIIINK